jgi:hypothetical protein
MRTQHRERASETAQRERASETAQRERASDKAHRERESQRNSKPAALRASGSAEFPVLDAFERQISPCPMWPVTCRLTTSVTCRLTTSVTLCCFTLSLSLCALCHSLSLCHSLPLSHSLSLSLSASLSLSVLSQHPRGIQHEANCPMLPAPTAILCDLCHSLFSAPPLSSLTSLSQQQQPFYASNYTLSTCLVDVVV